MLRNTIAAVALTLAASSAHAACEYPRKIEVPNGTQATKEDMLTGQRAMKAYMESMNSYLDCIDAETSAAVEEGEAAEVTAERQRLANQKRNAAIDEMETLAAEFNAQVRAYKAKND